jgi:IS30 family transposase
MERYRRLSLGEREELSRMLAAGASLRAAAQAMQRAPSTLSRELTRHPAGGIGSGIGVRVLFLDVP